MIAAANADEQPITIVETLEPLGQTGEDQPEASKDASPLPSAAGQANAAGSGQTSQTESTANPDQQTGTKPNAQSTTKPQAQGSTDTETEANSNTKTNTSSNTDSDSDSEPAGTNQPDPAIANEQKYEQQMLQVQAKCTQDMKEVLNGAESSMKQLDKTDPAALQAFDEQLTKEKAAAEAACDSQFQEVSQKAEKDAVSQKVIDEWTQTFHALKIKLQRESEEKLLQLMGG